MNIFKQFESKKGQILQNLRKFGGKIRRGSKYKLYLLLRLVIKFILQLPMKYLL